MRIVDVSHEIEHGMVTYKGLPAPLVCDYLSREASRALYAEGTEFQIGRIDMVANTGTYVDAPFHRYADGADLARLPLERLAHVPALMVRVSEGQTAIPAAAFRGMPVRGRAVLVHTGWDRHWQTEQYFEGHPFLTAGAAEHLVAEGAVLVGIDSHNIDAVGDLRRPVHSTLLGAGVPIVEHLCSLGALPEDGFRFSAVPAKVAGMGTFPVRAYGLVE